MADDISIIKRIEQKLGKLLLKYDSDFLVVNGFTLNEKGNVNYLNILECNIKDIRRIISDLVELKSLCHLHLYGNYIEDITSLKELKGLTKLNLSKNNIDDISPLRELKNLKILGLSQNRLIDITPLKDLKNLTDLSLTDNKIKNIACLREIRHLRLLELSYNNISDISSLETLIDLEYLRIEMNHIRDISAIRFMKKLEFLWLWGNNISDISALKGLNNLQEICLNSNEIVELPSWITDFSNEILFDQGGNDNKIHVGGNPLKRPPIDVVEQGHDAIKNYFSQIEKEKGRIEYLFEAKLLVIGEGGTGKTTFTRKMLNVNSEMPTEKDTTLGIDVGNWVYEIDFSNTSNLRDVKFHVNLWDFGGQKIYQGTHQIFFCDKSFYVLIADTREQKTDFSYWLNTVEQLGGENSSLIIVLNKKFGHDQRLDESGYRQHFGKIIKAVIELDLKHDKGKILLLQDEVKMFLKQLPGIGDPLPSSWVSIREDLAREKANFISFDHFRKICEKYNIEEIDMFHTLSGYFNRIGAFTHYIDDPLLQERIYLNSNWLVKTVYKVLDNNIAKSKKGRLSEADIKRIWVENDLHYEINKLTQLMHKFGLMYRIPETDSYVVPAHLPTITPYNEWFYVNDVNILQFIYEFDKYMPQGIMSRLIVALNHHITNHDHVWHRGVNIESNGAHAEIIESYGGSNRFEIRIAGANKIELLAIIRERFAEVLRPFNNLSYKQLVPCICDECKCSEQPAFHEYNLLLKFREKGTGSQCSKTGEIVSAEELLKTTELTPKKRDLGFPIRRLATNEQFDIKTIKIFLASSSELIAERKAFREFISVENDRLHKEGVYLELVQWEYFIDAMSKKDLQSEYNKALKECDIFLSLFFTKVGRYTAIEFENAFGEFKKTGKPLIYTYFKDGAIKANQIKKADIDSKFKFEARLAKLGHFKTIFIDVIDLESQFKRQLEKILQLL